MTSRIPIYGLVRERTLSGDYNRTVKSGADASKIVEDFIGKNCGVEKFVVLVLNIKNKIIGMNLCSQGTLSSSLVHPREVFRPAILLHGSAIIVAHNHPSGDPTPSQDDLAVTDRLLDSGKLLGIPVLDHIIIGDESFVSLVEHGYMTK